MGSHGFVCRLTVNVCVPAPAAVWAGAVGIPAVCCGPPVSASGPPGVLCAAAAVWPRRWARRRVRSAATPGASPGATAEETGPSCHVPSLDGRTRTVASCEGSGGVNVLLPALTDVKYQTLLREGELCFIDYRGDVWTLQQHSVRTVNVHQLHAWSSHLLKGTKGGNITRAPCLLKSIYILGRLNTRQRGRWYLAALTKWLFTGVE